MKNDDIKIIRGDWFDINFSGFLQNSEMLALFQQQKFTVKDTGNTYRVINHWTEIGLLDEDRSTKAGWRRFNLIDLVWLRVILELRKFGVASSKIAETKKCLISGKHHIFPFYTMIGLSTNIPVKILIFDNGAADIGCEEELSMSYQLGLLKGNYISLDLNQILKDLFPNFNYKKFVSPLVSLTTQETKALEAIRSGEFEIISIHLKEDRIERIEKRKFVNNTKKLTELIKEADYQDVTFKIRDGKIVHAEQKIQEK